MPARRGAVTVFARTRRQSRQVMSACSVFSIMSDRSLLSQGLAAVEVERSLPWTRPSTDHGGAEMAVARGRGSGHDRREPPQAGRFELGRQAQQQVALGPP